jgi:alanyl-tRNA synthetase
MIGPLRIVSEGSIGANTRRVEAVTGTASLAQIRSVDRSLEAAAALLRAQPDEVPAALDRLVGRQQRLEEELRQLRSTKLGERASALAAAAREGVVVAREGGLDPNELRELALSVRDRQGVRAVALVGSPDSGRVSLVVAAKPGTGVDARQVASEAAKAVGPAPIRPPSARTDRKATKTLPTNDRNMPSLLASNRAENTIAQYCRIFLSTGKSAKSCHIGTYLRSMHWRRRVDGFFWAARAQLGESVVCDW